MKYFRENILNLDLIMMILLIGLSSIHAKSILKRSAENSNDNLEKVDDSMYKVDYDVYPVSERVYFNLSY